MTKKTHYEVKLKHATIPETIPVVGEISVQVDQGALVFMDTGPTPRVLSVFAPGEWLKAKRVETD